MSPWSQPPGPRAETCCLTRGGRQLGPAELQGPASPGVRPPSTAHPARSSPSALPRPRLLQRPCHFCLEGNQCRFSEGRAVDTHQLRSAQTGHQGPVPGAPGHSRAARAPAEAVPVASHRDGLAESAPPEPLPPRGQAGSASQGSVCRGRRESQRAECPSERTPSPGDGGTLAIRLVSVQPSRIRQGVSITELPRPSAPPRTASCRRRRPSGRGSGRRTSRNKEPGPLTGEPSSSRPGRGADPYGGFEPQERDLNRQRQS